MPRARKQTKWTTWLILMALALGLGWMYRATDLAKRPMHTDEAIHGIKLLDLYKTGRFEYDPHDYHGPFLHYSTKWIGSLLHYTPETLNETNLRFVIVLFGLALLIVPVLLSDVLGRRGSAISALLIAVSPLMVYYSRYYIMEVPFAFLVSLFMMAVWRWTQSKSVIWLIVAGLTLGLMHATKETFVLNLMAMAAGWVMAKMIVGSFSARQQSLRFGRASRGLGSGTAFAIMVGIAVITSVAMFSNGFRDWQGVKDSVLTYQFYFQRSGNVEHAKPWHYYLTLLFWRKNDFVWTEALIGGLALVGILNSFVNTNRPPHHRAFLIFLSVYAVALLVGYSIIPYKTPWSILCVDHAFALLAGVGMSGIFSALDDNPLGKTIIGGLFAAGLYNLCRQTSFATDYPFATARYSCDDRNPYVYSHTSPKLVELAKRIHELAAKHADGKDMPVQVIDSEQGWPLPWYLRDMKHVGYQAEVPAKIDAAVVVVDSDKTEAVQAKLKGPYDATEPYGLRPGILLNLFVQEDLWNSFMNIRTEPEPKPAPVPEPKAEPATPTPAGLPAVEAFVGPPVPTLTTAPPVPALPGAEATTPPIPAIPRAMIVTDDDAALTPAPKTEPVPPQPAPDEILGAPKAKPAPVKPDL